MRFAVGALLVVGVACATAPAARAPEPPPGSAPARAPAPVAPPPPRAPPAPPPSAPAPPPEGEAALPEAPAEAPLPAREPAAEEGLASFYADSLAGHRTASGERYRPERETCAHRTHPFGTRLRVTAIKSGRSALCRVNDRGPWVAGRVLDVSRRVAEQLRMIGPGVLRVRVSVAEE